MDYRYKFSVHLIPNYVEDTNFGHEANFAKIFISNYAIRAGEHYYSDRP